jgi:hypothetical protein
MSAVGATTGRIASPRTIISEAMRPALRRPDKSSDLVASDVREVDDLSTRLSVGAEYEQSHIYKTR